MTDANNLFIEKLFAGLGLGSLIHHPTPCEGGLLHRMYRAETAAAVYAVKALNPQIMQRPAAMGNMLAGERIAALAARSIPAISALLFEGAPVLEMEGQFFLIYPWVEGRSLSIKEINPRHCECLGRLLAGLHGTDFGALNPSKSILCNKSAINWAYYLNKGIEIKSQWCELLEQNLDHLIGWNRKMLSAALVFSTGCVISHRDLDPKNVLWVDADHPIVIDWESAGRIHPAVDLMETALYWSENPDGSHECSRFSAFIRAYLQKNPRIKAEWKTVLQAGYASRLGWLEYSLNRSLGIECDDPNERLAGSEQAVITLQALRQYESESGVIECWMADLQPH